MSKQLIVGSWLKILFFTFLLSTIHYPLSTVLATPGDSGGIILEEPVAVRAVGLGEAYTALSEGASGSFWNPAGLSYQNLFILETGMMTGYDAAGLITMGFAKPLKSGGAFALNVLQYSAGDMELITLDPISGQVTNTETVSAQDDMVVQAAYGRRIWKLDVGIGIKSLQSTLAEEYSAATVCADFGLMLRSKDRKRSIGFAARNIGGALTYISEADAVPMTIGIGLFWRWLGSEKLKIQTLFDIKQNENETHINLGNEFLWRGIALRFGYQTGYDIKSLSMGVGLKLGKLNIDSSYTPTDAFDDVIRFSLSYNLAFKPKEEKYVAPEIERKLKTKKGEKINIAVSDFVAQPPMSSAEASFIAEFFRGDLTKYKVFTVVDRSNMDKILAEQGFQQTGCTTAECAIQMGKLLNVQKIVNGKVGKLVNRYIVTISVIDVESGEIEYSDKDSCYKPDDLESTVAKLVKRLAAAAQ